MDKVNQLNKVTKKINDFNEETTLNLKLHVEQEIHNHKQILPNGLFYGATHEVIDSEVNKRMDKFKENTDLKPLDLYSYLKSQFESNPDLSKRQLHYLAYEYLADTTSSKFLRRIFKSMKRGAK